MNNVNQGYQDADKNFINYELWNPFTDSFAPIRGPQFDMGCKPYFSTIGAAQTFGRFVTDPFPILISKKIQLEVLNLGFSGAGPSFFLKSQEIINFINKSKFCIIQIPSGRSVENSIFATSTNQGLLIEKKDPGKTEHFAEYAYQKLISMGNLELLSSIRNETRLNYLYEMIELLSLIKVPKILFYFSQRDTDYQEGLGNIGEYLGQFPHFVNEKMINVIKKYADNLVKSISSEGLPQPIFDSNGVPQLIWEESKFPTVKYRYHNNYYPSPEMHKTAANNLSAIIENVSAFI